jgi:5-methylcytosine-specific restriction enzyme subunit McrC
MPRNKTIRVFEYDEIKQGHSYDGVLFEERDLHAIQRFNDKNKHRYFTLTHNGVKFNSYVGVIQIGRVTIEVLPKADKRINKDSADEQTKDAWKRILLEMLKKSGMINMVSLTHADLKLRNTSLLDLYINHFLNEVETILRQGLVKHYRQNKGNVLALKGRMLFHQQITKNRLHKERFYTEHQVYDYNHIVNQILIKALDVLERLPNSSLYLDRILRLKMAFPELEDVHVNESTFKRLQLNRKTQSYSRSLQLAKLIILNYSPDIQGGKEDVLAILFDMNELWERYVFKMLQKEQKEFNYSVSYQNRKKFWNNKLIKPDIVLKLGSETLVIDTKWKLVDANRPSDADLKQMYTYNMYWEANKSMLLYPTSENDLETDFGEFHIGSPNKKSDENLCKMAFLNIWETSNGNIKLKSKIALEVLNQFEIL